MMRVGSKYIASFLLGAAAALAANKYMNMTTEEKEKLAADLKDKAHKLKGATDSAIEKGKVYVEELTTKGADAMKERVGDIGSVLQHLFGTKSRQT